MQYHLCIWECKEIVVVVVVVVVDYHYFTGLQSLNSLSDSLIFLKVSTAISMNS